MPYRYARGPHASPARKSRQTEKKKKKLRELPAWSPGACAAALPPESRAGPRPPGRAGLPASSPRALRARPGLGTYLVRLSSAQVLAVFTWVFKQVSGRKKKGKKSNYANRLRTGRRAPNLTPLPHEFSEQPRAGRFMGARHRYARSRRPGIAKFIKAVMSTFPATLRARVYCFTDHPEPGWAGALSPNL